MYLLERRNNVDSIWEVGNELIFVSGNNLTNIQGVKLYFKEDVNFFYSDRFIYNVKSNEIDIFDNSFELKKKTVIKDPVNISFYETIDNYLIRHGKKENLYSLFLNNTLVKEEESIVGRFLNSKYRLHFKFRFKPISYFRCSDLLDEVTYWEYDCGEGYVADRFYVLKDNLVFVKGGEKGSILLVMELLSGRIIWEQTIQHGAFNMDEEHGLLVSVWGNKHMGNNFQLIDIQKQTVISDKINTDYNLENVNVHWQQQYLHQNKLYFSDNIHSYGDDLRPIKFGCFDIETENVDFLQEVSEAAGGQFAQVIYHNNKLYLRTSGNELFIFEDKNGAV